MKHIKTYENIFTDFLKDTDYIKLYEQINNEPQLLSKYLKYQNKFIIFWMTRLPNQDDYAIVYFGGIVEIRDGHKAQLEFLKSEDEDNDSSNFVHDFNVDLTLRSLEDDMFIS